MSDELRPCPFCAKQAMESDNPQDFFSGLFDVACPHCGASGPDVYVDADMEQEDAPCAAIVAWNHRPIEDALRAENERLRANACPCSNRGDCNISVSCVRARVAQLEAVAEAAVELRDLVEDMMVGAYQPDSFTLQPIEIALQAAGYKEEDEDDE